MPSGKRVEAYIRSQPHKKAGGWSRLNTTMAAIRAAPLVRALKGLLADLRAGKVQVVVVYKLDRLSRSLSDFAS